MADLTSLDATALLQALDARRISAVELLDASMAHGRRLKPSLNAVVAEDADRARETAAGIDARRVAGETSETIGRLAGLPMTIKDTFDVEGLPASSGLQRYLGRKAEDAAAAAHARREGAVIWGKTNVPVLAGDWQTSNALYGQTNNPWDLERTPGGSSGGAAAALASGVTPLEIGSDIGGSLRVPAHFCGVFAHKPTWGLVSQLGEIPPEPGAAAERDLNVVGPLARSARDLRLLLSVLAPGPLAAKAPAAALGGLKVALWLDDPAFILDAEVKTTLEGFASDLAAEGAHVEAVSSPTPGEALLSVYQALLLPLMTLTMDERRYRRLRLLRGPASLLSARSARARTVRDLTLSHRDWLIANERRAVITRTMRMFFGRYDVLIAPIAPVTAFPHTPGRYAQRSLRCSDGRKIPYESMIHWIALASACGLPATAAPVGFGASGLPVGAQIIGPRGGDAKTLAVAQAVEERLGGFRSPPMDWRGYKAD